MAEELENIIELTDEEGKVIKCQLFDIIEFEGKDYAILSEIDDEEQEAIIVHYTEENDMSYFETIDDDDEFERVSEYVDQLIAEFEEEEENPDEEE